MPSYSTVSPNYNIPEQNGKVPRLEKHSMDDGVTDTVGVVVMDSTGNVASTVSSGGIALKQMKSSVSYLNLKKKIVNKEYDNIINIKILSWNLYLERFQILPYDRVKVHLIEHSKDVYNWFLNMMQ